jgi:hypothetical protein
MNDTAKNQGLIWADGKEGPTTHLRRKGFDVIVRTMYDRDAELFDHLGTYTDELREGVIVRSAGIFFEDWPEDQELPKRGREYRGFRPYAAGEKPGTPDYKTYGLQDYARAEALNRGDWSFVGIVADVYKAGVKLASSGVWGVESDSDQSYLDECAEEEANNAVESAIKVLRNLCGGE